MPKTKKLCPDPVGRQTAARRAEPVQEVPDDDLDEDEEDDRDSVAEALIRWVPPITAIVCAAVALCGFVYYQFVL